MGGKQEIHTPPFEANVALIAVKGERIVYEVGAPCDLRPR
jgi:hypothetical protein